MGLVKKLIIGGTVYGVAREFNKNRNNEPQSRQAAPEPYPPQQPQQSQQHHYYPAPPPLPPSQQQPMYYAPPQQQQQQQQYYQGPPAYDQSQPAPYTSHPRQAWDEKR